ncbi:hypothetical protein OGZ33_01815 [Lactococcus lactis]|uniref:hypothetical protein n=1 Tax=Lactococcus lactis TaxID=1358 RepID=UPI002418AB2E|nr:hypothetical protein [Lactococcus lactis]MDG4962976.1 hypothetical protein [Lactococcus lactis]
MTDKQFDEMDFVNQAVFLIDEVLKYLGETDIVMEDVHDQEENLQKLKKLVKDNMLPF